jgi:predicted Ser/Thr protein kinase
VEDQALSRIGKYEILDKIGEGGFGVVYKGRDPFIKRLVAVKTCSSENQQIQQRFFREAEIAGNLHHANVVTIHDFGIEGETPYLVQEFLTGEDLDVVIKAAFDSLTLPTKVRYLRGIAEGLRYAHSQGVIHRDIKPSNIRVLENGRVKVMDFGIAKLKDQESQLTQTGMALGTVAYMSPEQLRGEKIDHRVDIFSYGVLAYELLAGHRPFRAETVSTLFYQLLHEPPPPFDLPYLPTELIAVVDRCLSKSVEERYQSFDEVIAALDQVAALITGAEEVRPENLFRPDAQSEAESSAHRLAAKALRSIDAGDLTAAAMTINMARREVDQVTFERVFGSILEAFRELEQRQSASAESGPRLADAEQLLGDVELKLLADDYPGAEAALARLEALLPGDQRVQTLRQRFTAALGSRPTAPGAELRRVQPPQPPSMSQEVGPTLIEPPTFQPSRGLGRWPLAIAAATVGVVAVVLLSWVLLSSPDDVEATDADDSISEGDADPNPSGTGATDRETTPTGPAEAGAIPSLPGDPSGAATGPGAQASGATTSPTAAGDAAATAAATDRDRPGPPSSTQSAATETGTRPGGASTRTERTVPATPETRPRVDRPPASDSATRRDTTAPTRDPGTPSQPGGTRREETPSEPPAEEPRREEPPVTTPTINIADLREQDAIRRTLAAYQNAWKSLDHDAINLVHPSANLNRRDVRTYRLADVSFSECSFRIQGDSATASCRVTRTVEPRDGSSPQVQRFSGFALSKRGSGWIIDSLLPAG